MSGPPDITFDNLSLAFGMAPVGLCISHDRIIRCVNEELASIFRYGVEDLAGKSLSCLYPSAIEFENIGKRGYPVMQQTGRYSDERIMRRGNGELFWCHVAGRSLNKSLPFSCAVWMFEDISTKRPVSVDLTVREREIAQLLVRGDPTKVIGKKLGISPRTVEAHQSRLIKKLSVKSVSV